jgi:hypothetical protein
MTMTTCTIRNCTEPAQWEITIEGHDNVPGRYVTQYCTGHLTERAGLVYQDNSKPYTQTVRGPIR